MHLHLLGLLLVVVVVTAKPHCPAQCFCSTQLTSVDCRGKRITIVLPDIPLQVEKLFLSNNKISEILPYAFASFQHLQYLDLRQNILTEIKAHSFANITQLGTLYLTANDIQRVHPEAFEGSPQVTYLSLGANLLTALPPLPYLVNLGSIILDANKISNATFPKSYSVNVALTDVVMSNNPILKLLNTTFSSLRKSNVRKLEISRSSIRTVESGTFEPLKNLMSLKIGYNPLDSSQLVHVIHGLSRTSLVSLDIRNLSLAGRLPSETFRLLHGTNIKYLKMLNNKIDNLPPGAFSNLPQLLLIDLSACGIQTISPKAFENLTELQTLFLSDNSLATVPSGFPASLTKLGLNGNQIDTLKNGDFKNLEILEELNLVKNLIHEFQEDAFLGLAQLRKLHLAYNKISTLPGKLFRQFTRLMSLDLNGNYINVIPPNDGRFSSMTSLEYLNLNSNNLQSMPLNVLQPLESLLYLYLNNNKLRDLIATDNSGELFKNFGKLKELYLSNNDLQTLPESMLGEQKFLTILDLSKNSISHWHRHLFSTTRSLHTLDMSSNWISLINETSVSNLRSLTSWNLTRNPFACNCNARWFCTWMNSTDVVLVQKEKYQCTLPSNWQGQKMSLYCQAHVNCTDYTLYYIIGGVLGGCLVSLLVCFVLYRYRWFVKYKLYRAGRAMRLVRRPQGDYTLLQGEDKAFDIYISYAEKDRDWVVKNIVHKLDVGTCLGIQCDGQYQICFKDRDFDPTRMEISSMENSLRVSRDVIIVATEEYVKSALCRFEFDLVMQMQASRDISKYHLIKVGTLPLSIPCMMEKLIQRHEYMEWLDPKCAERTFLDRLTDRIGHNTIGANKVIA